MCTTNVTRELPFRSNLAWTIALAALTLFCLGLARSSFGRQSPPQESQPKTFSSPGEAGNALFEAARSGDEQALEAILGAGKEVTSSSDEVEDKLEREQFTQKYEEMHRLVQEADGSTVLYIGAENWPFPVPLVSKDGAWYFDSKAGMEEIRFRRVGENEATAVQVCEEFAMAKNARAAKAASYDPITQFAESLASGAADADNKESNPFHGYYFRVVTLNSASGASGPKKRGGLTLVAYPVEYQSSGVMTFVVTQRGIVFETDLGSNTATVASNLTERSPKSNWRTAE
jgi:hypothetical protein